MSQEAAECRHPQCTRRTTTPFCWQHRSITAPLSAPRQTAPSARQATHDDMLGTPTACWNAAATVMPGLQGAHMHPTNIRNQVRAKIREAISIETVRRAPALDNVNDRQRHEDLVALASELIYNSRLTKTELTPEEAADILNSTQDRFGMGMQERTALASYGLRCEWSLANLQGIKADENGIPYDQTFEHFLYAQEGMVQGIAAEQYRLDLGQWESMIRYSTGREPVNAEPPALGIIRNPDGSLRGVRQPAPAVEPTLPPQRPAFTMPANTPRVEATRTPGPSPAEQLRREEEERQRRAAKESRKSTRGAFAKIIFGAAAGAALDAADIGGERRAARNMQKKAAADSAYQEQWSNELARREQARLRRERRR